MIGLIYKVYLQALLEQNSNMKYKKHPERILRHMISMPFIYMMIIPFAILDAFILVYHNVAFPLYGIQKVERQLYIKIDRHKLSKLGLVQKLNCIYCGYINGLSAYAVAVAGETEKYWCGIQHDASNGYVVPEHQKNFEARADYK